MSSAAIHPDHEVPSLLQRLHEAGQRREDPAQHTPP